jgi:hypothetical protein
MVKAVLIFVAIAVAAGILVIAFKPDWLSFLRSYKTNKVLMVENLQVETIAAVDAAAFPTKVTFVNAQIILDDGTLLPLRQLRGERNLYVLEGDTLNPTVEISPNADFAAFLKEKPEMVYWRGTQTAVFFVRRNKRIEGMTVDLTHYTEAELSQWEEYVP